MNSVDATKAAPAGRRVAVTEAGFGAGLGARNSSTSSGRPPYRPLTSRGRRNRARSHHGGVYRDRGGTPLSAGAVNLRRHCENLTKVFAQRVLVAVNRFAADTEAEISRPRPWPTLGIDVVLTDHFGRGGARFCRRRRSRGLPSIAKSAYSLADSLVPRRGLPSPGSTAGADGSNLRSRRASSGGSRESGWGELPVCMAKTQYSPPTRALGATPEGFSRADPRSAPRQGAGLSAHLRLDHDDAGLAQAPRPATSTWSTGRGMH